MFRATAVGCGIAGLFGADEVVLAQRRPPPRGIPIGGGSSSSDDTALVIVLLLAAIVLAVVLVIGLAQMLVHGGLHALMWTVVGMVNVYEWFRPPAELESKLEQKRLAAGGARGSVNF